MRILTVAVPVFMGGEGGCEVYTASTEFHNAVANNAHQIALLIFSDAVFTNADIDVSKGISFNEYFNTEEDIAIGQVLSNELSFSLFNDVGALDEYEFGEFTATIGAQIGESAVQNPGGIRAESTDHVYIGRDTSPYLTIDGVVPSSAPQSAVKSILVYGGTVYCYLANGTCVGYSDSAGSRVTVSMNAFMLEQMAKWAADGKGIFYNASTRILKIWQGTKLRTYEFVPLGVYIAERPNVPTVNLIDFTCYDRMLKFEKDMPSDSAMGITYPCSFGNLMKKMCDYLQVPYRTTTFINSTATISERPEDFDSATMRDVLRWIAEAACSNARFDRDGYLVMDWVRNTAQELNESDYIEFNPYWYETKKVTKLYNRASSGEYDNTRGTGAEPYLIQDNPLLKGVT